MKSIPSFLALTLAASVAAHAVDTSEILNKPVFPANEIKVAGVFKGGGAKGIVELGTGYGYNLFSLHHSHPDWSLKGFDISPNGITAGREIADRFGLSGRISLDRIDLTDASDPNLSAIAGEVVLTYFCIEQIPYDVRKVIDNIIAAKPKRVINIEPTTELLDLTHPRDLVSLFYIRSVDYQTHLFTVLNELEREGRIRIIARERMPFAPSINNDGFLYCWEPT